MSNKLVGSALLLGSVVGYSYYQPKSPEMAAKASAVSVSEADAFFEASTAPVESVIPADLQPLPLQSPNLKDSAYPEEIKDSPETQAAEYFQDLWANSEDLLIRWVGPVRRAIAAVVENRQAVRAMRQERAAMRNYEVVPQEEVLPEVGPLPEPEPTPVELPPVAPAPPVVPPVVDPVDGVVPEVEPTPIEGKDNGVPKCECCVDCKCCEKCPCKQKAAPVKAVVQAIKATPKPRYVTKYRTVRVCYPDGCRIEQRPYQELVKE